MPIIWKSVKASNLGSKGEYASYAPYNSSNVSYDQKVQETWKLNIFLYSNFSGKYNTIIPHISQSEINKSE